MAEFMVYGAIHPRVERMGLPLNTPLSLEQAARAAGLRLRNARQVAALPQFQKLIVESVNAIRSGEYSRNIHTLVAIRDDVGENSAADKKTRIEAARTLMGPDEAKGGPRVTVNVNNAAISAGYVIDLSGDDRPPVIEGAAEGPPTALLRSPWLSARTRAPGADLEPGEELPPVSTDSPVGPPWGNRPSHCPKCGVMYARGRAPCACTP
jgi:hypothetical protein